MKLLLTISIILFSQYGLGQLKGHVVDLESNPIAFATVQLVNFETGAITDQNGNFQIRHTGNKEVYLLISHIGFESKMVSSKSLTKPIILKDETTQLDDVIVETKSDKQWKKDLNKFEEELFGFNEAARKSKILNPWVLEFESSRNKLNATAFQPLIIQNNLTGYKISFVLERFANSGLSTDYQGKPFFEELDGNYSKKRSKVYLGSKRHFMFSLINGISREEGYKIYRCELDRQTNAFIQSNALSPDRLVKPIEDGWELSFNGFIKVIYTKEKDPHISTAYVKGDALVVQDNGQVSYLESIKTVKIDKYGNVIGSGLRDFGYWANMERVAHMLPHDYLPERLSEFAPKKLESIPEVKGFQLTDLLIPEDEIMDGGTPKDGIPAIFYPPLKSGKEIMDETEEVLGVTWNGESRAYPIKVLNYHEVVNDTLGGQPILISYCPLCGSGVSFLPKSEDEALTFGVSGLLYNSDVLLYDQQTESLWSQLLGKAISGEYSGKELQQIPTARMSWGEWLKRNPNSTSMDPDLPTGLKYDTDPYQSYQKSSKLMFPVKEESDKLPSKEIVIGIDVDGTTKAYPFSKLKKEEGSLTDTLNGKTFTIHFNKETQSAWIDSSDWDNGVKATVLFWFAWYAFNPSTFVY